MSYTYTTLEIGAEAFDHILTKIHAAGEEYVERYYHVRVAEGLHVIHFAGSEVALVTRRSANYNVPSFKKNSDKKDPRCLCKGFYQPRHCPIHGKENSRVRQKG